MKKIRNDSTTPAQDQTTENVERARVRGIKTIDCTPTWTGLMPAFFEILESGTTEGKKEVQGELLRLADALDKHNAAIKKETAHA